MKRRNLIAGLVGLVGAPAIVRAASLMPISLQPQVLRWRAAWPGSPVYRVTFLPNGDVLYEIARHGISAGQWTTEASAKIADFARA